MSSTERIRVMLVDDHPIMRNGLRHALESEGDFVIVGQAGDGREAVRVAEIVEPDVIVMDVMMPHKDGVEALSGDHGSAAGHSGADANGLDRRVNVVVEAVAAGATGYLQKYTGPEELADAVRDVAQDRMRIPDKSLRHVFATIPRPARAHCWPDYGCVDP